MFQVAYIILPIGILQAGYLVAMLEWLTFVCTHSREDKWKVTEEDFPLLVKMVMAKGM